MANVTYITPSKERHVPASFAFDPSEYPESPGCYLMYGADGGLLYVGKAVNLRRRLASYFRKSATAHRKAEMIRRIRAIAIFLVRNEREALVLESNLIRCHAPSYNSRFTRRGDSYYYVAMTDEAFPRFVPYRRDRSNYALDDADGAYDELFGPYVGWNLRNDLLHAVRSLFPIRTCHRMPGRMCERGQSGRCLAPCEGRASKREYRGVAQRARGFLLRPPAAQVRSWKLEMAERSAEQAYDEARRLRDWIRAAEHARLPQITELDEAWDLDVIWLQDDWATVLQVRDGDTVGLRRQSIVDVDLAARPIVANRALAIAHPRHAVCVPASEQSPRGQLLRIAKINAEWLVVPSTAPTPEDDSMA